MDQLIALVEVERRTGIPLKNETPTEYIRKVLQHSSVDETTTETVVEAYQYGLFAENPTFNSEQAAALERFADALSEEKSVEDSEFETASDADSDTTELAAGERSIAKQSGESGADESSTRQYRSERMDGGDVSAESEANSKDVSVESAADSKAVPTERLPDPDSSTARLGTWLVVLSIFAFVITVLVGAAFTPSVGEVGGSSAVADGDTSRNGTLVSLQVGGKIVEYGPQGDQIASTDKLTYGGAYFGVSKIENGSVLAAYMRGGYDECGPYDAKCFHTGFRTLDFQNGTTDVHSEWSYPIRTARSSEVHDVELLPSGDVLVAGMEYERVFIVNRSTGNVTWQWNASSFYDAPDDPTQEDWLHINDVDRISDGRYLVSVRNEYQILVVERGEGVVEVINEEQDPNFFLAQHNPQYLGQDAILVADSENDRVVEVHRNDGEWEVVWELKSAGGIELDWPRDADRLPNGNTLITDTHNERVIEVTRDGTVVWSVETGRVPYEADRLPNGEYPAGDPYRFDGGGRSIGESSEDLPVFGYLLASLRHVVPVPYWVTDWHLVVFSVSFVGMVVGGVLRWRG